MNDETPINEDSASRRRRLRLPGPLEAAGFAFQERVIWPLQDRFSLLGPGPNRALLGGGAAAMVVAGAAVAIALSSGGGGSSDPTTTTAAEAPTAREPLVATAPKPTPKADPAPRETLHGAAPVFSPPSPASKGGEKTGESGAVEEGAAVNGDSDSTASSAGDAAGSAGDTTSPPSTSSSPANATISSDPDKSSKAAQGTAGTAAARAALPDGPPAGPAALKVAREFAQGFVVYETGGEESDFRDAFEASATPELTKALLQRPPKQPAGVKVPRAKVLNVVAGPSQGKVYKVSVSLLRVGVTSELRLDMEKTGSGKRVEWRVTNVLG